MRTGCVRKVIVATLDAGLGRSIAEALRSVEHVVVERVPGEEPLDLYRVALAFTADVPPESLLVVTDAVIVVGLEEARARIGLVKLLRVHGCSVDEIVETVKAVSCRNVPAPCPVDAGLGWLQA